MPNPCFSLGQLAAVPAAAEGADEAYAVDELTGLEVDGGALILEQGGFGGDDVEVGVDAGLVACGGDVEKALGGGDRGSLPLDLLRQHTHAREVVFNLLKGGQDSLLIDGDISVELRVVLTQGGVAEAAIKKGF